MGAKRTALLRWLTLKRTTVLEAMMKTVHINVDDIPTYERIAINGKSDQFMYATGPAVARL